LYMTVNGKAETSWNETESYTDHEGKSQTRTVHYGAEETYLNSVTYLVGSEQGSEVQLESGKHIHNFMCALPALLPCSYEGGTGFVRYTIKVTLDRPWKFDQTSKAAFTVISPLDLNLDPRYRLPVSRESTKTLWCGCSTKPMRVNVELPRTGYAPGEEIAVTCNVSNETRVDVEYLHIKITKIAKFHSRSPHKIKHSSTDLVTVSAEGVPRYTKTSITRNIQLPVIPPSLLHNCSIIDIDYVIKVKASIPGCHRSMRLELPFTVGTVPLSNRPEQPEIGFANVAPSAPPITAQPGAGAPNDDLPPSYEECMFGAQSIRDNDDSQYTIGFQNFTPLYPVYNSKQ
ncbi:arrestin domain-containing protein 2-like, partial [Ctenocephalides felis]|uniref:arrestin domain-containing protein 2-like n=2 Tax=Ctenocephalides felis TaxID=7515 RepID=UPI000E6E5AAC